MSWSERPHSTIAKTSLTSRQNRSPPYYVPYFRLIPILSGLIAIAFNTYPVISGYTLAKFSE